MTTAHFSDKVVARATALERMQDLPRPVVFTNGVFDVLHRGHVTYLEQARAMGASLVVALNTDASVKRLGKGLDKTDIRPLNNEQDRCAVIAALESVSLVTTFDEDTPIDIIRQLRPDTLVKGGDYDMSLLAETQVVESYGGTAVAIAFVSGYSTTALVQKIKSSSS